jgi:hypothetical protein
MAASPRDVTNGGCGFAQRAQLAKRNAMNVRYHLIAPSELDSSLTDVWRVIQVANDRFSSPYFDPEFTRLVAEVRNDVRVVIIENERRIVGFFPYQRNGLGLGKPVGGPLSDYHGVICTADSEWTLDGLL